MSAAVNRPSIRIRVLSLVRVTLIRAMQEHSCKKGSQRHPAENRGVLVESHQ
jgi:hypothetical protein